MHVYDWLAVATLFVVPINVLYSAMFLPLLKYLTFLGGLWNLLFISPCRLQVHWTVLGLDSRFPGLSLSGRCHRVDSFCSAEGNTATFHINGFVKSRSSSSERSLRTICRVSQKFTNSHSVFSAGLFEDSLRNLTLYSDDASAGQCSVPVRSNARHNV